MVVGGGEMTSADNVHSVLLAPEARLVVEQALASLYFVQEVVNGRVEKMERLLESVLARQQNRMSVSSRRLDGGEEHV